MLPKRPPKLSVAMIDRYVMLWVSFPNFCNTFDPECDTLIISKSPRPATPALSKCLWTLSPHMRLTASKYT